ncbi:cadherin-like protein 26 isoform X2 [Myripristis murdjan]|uniref:cadherin-like protein 26 isoform X2 n=1 Tax=Myripristis murdjan TaxID=586833 RepID=UPI00117610DF|nr:cadherin-2-like isoform X2 [Myripristis murdjan]
MEKIHISLLMMLCLAIHKSSSDILRRQKRNWIIDSFSIEEESTGPFPYELGTIEIEKKFTVLRLHGQGVDKDPIGLLQINQGGTVTVHKKVDYEQYRKLKLTFEAYDEQNERVDTRLGMEVKILDINDHTPTFDKQEYKVSKKESDSQDTYVVTLLATDQDSRNTPNGTFDMKLISVTPQSSDLEFSLIQNGETGTIDFNGCLDYQKAEKYTILVEVKDRGEKIKRSSTGTVIINIEDENNYLPVFTGQSGPGKVKEYEKNVLVLRLHVTDKDTKGTAAWKVKYTIHGDTNNNFRITTDPETNDGLLYVEKELDYEVDALKNLTISVQNEAPYSSCKVRNRLSSGKWDVVTVKGELGKGQVPPPSTIQVTVNVEDVNDPPIFTTAFKQVKVKENVPVGYYLETFTAIDLDGTHANQFEYSKGDDPGDWVTVDSKTGKITTSKILDRESPFVKDNIYNVTIYAVDSGTPPLTGTGTLEIYLKDENDNTPVLAVHTVDMCISDGPSQANITAFDIDGDPYSGPFRFVLQGDVKDKWSVVPDIGYTVNLVKEDIVYAGHHELQLEVFDLQEQSSVHNLSVTVCDCFNPMMPNCRIRRPTGSSMGGMAIGMVLVALLLFLGILLLGFLVSCKDNHEFIPIDDPGNNLMKCNTENPGTDCKVVLNSIIQEDVKQGQTAPADVSTAKPRPSLTRSESMGISPTYSYSMHQWHRQSQRGNTIHRPLIQSAGARQTYTDYHMNQEQSRGAGWYELGNSKSLMTNTKYSAWGKNGYSGLLSVLDQRIYTLEEKEKN